MGSDSVRIISFYFRMAYKKYCTDSKILEILCNVRNNNINDTQALILFADILKVDIAEFVLDIFHHGLLTDFVDSVPDME